MKNQLQTETKNGPSRRLEPVGGSNSRDQYVDYRNRVNVLQLNRIKVNAKWYDFYPNPLVGLYNTLNYNR